MTEAVLAGAPGTTGEPVLSVRDLSVSFRSDTRTVHAVDGVSYDLRPGEVLAVVGESGCGKSVTSMAVMGLLPPTARVGGSIRLGGRELVGASEKELRKVRGKDIAMIFQEPMTSLNPVLTIGRQIGEVLRRHRGMSRKEARARAVELLDLVGIPAPQRRIEEYPHQLSGGMRQRVMIAIAVACDPAVLIADEPTTALDVTVQAGILEVLQSLRERLGTAIVLVTHDLGVVADAADRVLVMYAGRPVEQAPVHDLFGAARHPYTRGLLGAVLRPGGEGKRRLPEIPGLVPSLDSQPDACTFAPRCGRADDACTGGRPGFMSIAPEAGADAPHRAACWHPYGVDDRTGTESPATTGATDEPTVAARPDQEAGE
ncbi:MULTISPECIES: ABC transporter ATP-binding protein [unclassified Streptomyces]|uniref:ABC transporter ATP-binding protein n=1 Tax=unclassified Streptomyces TaxID=2593676 RepID=UPI00081BA0A8|nr:MULTISPECIES: ABC transporter ATP-binding protein [unclassified Streptomyces]MYQ84857.1 ATP-binding cassette domain-containing protein [Streptomyces sp. SID4936]SCD94044.1 peptide/nickel transport system ATP-binding protein [Streptomyces sp. DvalAA-43]